MPLCSETETSIHPFSCMRLSPLPERPVEVEGSADQGQVGEGLREVAQRLAGRTDLLGVEPEVVGVAEHLLEDEAGIFEPSGARQGLDEPERAKVEGALLAHEAVGGLLDVVAEDEAVGDQPVVFRGTVYGVEGAEHPGTL